MGCCGSKAKEPGEEPLLAGEAAEPEPGRAGPRPPPGTGEALEAAAVVGRVTGSALLQLAETVPVLAPVAFLVGAVASSACEATQLREDCLEFGKVVQMMEGILLKAEGLEDQASVIDEVREALEEALRLLEAMRERGALQVFWTAQSQRNKFEEIRDRIKRAIQRLSLTTSLDTNALARAQFKQSESLQKKMEEMGGAAAVADDPEKLARVQEHLEGSDALLLESVRSSRRDFQAVGSTVAHVQGAVREMQAKQQDQIRQAQAALQHQTQTQAALEGLGGGQVAMANSLTTLTESFMQMQKETELRKMQNEVLSAQVNELKSMLSEVKDCMKLFPVPAKEPARMVVVEQGGFMNMTPRDEGFGTLQEICREATQRWGLISLVNMIGANQQFAAAGYMPELAVQEKVDPERAGAIQSAQLAVDMCGLQTPRKASICQHVVASEKPLVYSGSKEAPPTARPEDLMAASKVDPQVREFLTKMAEGNPFSHARGSEGREEAMRIAFEMYKEFLGAEDTMFYAGVPIFVEGQVVGSFCMLGPKAPPGWVGDPDMADMKAQAARASASLTLQLQHKRMQDAQNQMMQQMLLVNSQR